MLQLQMDDLKLGEVHISSAQESALDVMDM